MQKQQQQKALLSELVSVLFLLIVINHKLLARRLNVAFFLLTLWQGLTLVVFWPYQKEIQEEEQNGSA